MLRKKSIISINVTITRRQKPFVFSWFTSLGTPTQRHSSWTRCKQIINYLSIICKDRFRERVLFLLCFNTYKHFAFFVFLIFDTTFKVFDTIFKTGFESVLCSFSAHTQACCVVVFGSIRCSSKNRFRERFFVPFLPTQAHTIILHCYNWIVSKYILYIFKIKFPTHLKIERHKLYRIVIILWSHNTSNFPQHLILYKIRFLYWGKPITQIYHSESSISVINQCPSRHLKMARHTFHKKNPCFKKYLK